MNFLRHFVKQPSDIHTDRQTAQKLRYLPIRRRQSTELSGGSRTSEAHAVFCRGSGAGGGAEFEYDCAVILSYSRTNSTQISTYF